MHTSTEFIPLQVNHTYLYAYVVSDFYLFHRVDCWLVIDIVRDLRWYLTFRYYNFYTAVVLTEEFFVRSFTIL